MPLPLAAIAIPAIGSFFASLFGNSNQRQQQQSQIDASELMQQRSLAAQQAMLAQELGSRSSLQDSLLAYQRGRDTQNTALDESKLDPWRGTMSQVGDAATLDRYGGTSYTPMQMTRNPNGGMSTTGGTSYAANPDVLNAARAAAKLILSGGGRVPTMTDPNNYGKTGTVNLLPGGKTNASGDQNDPWSLRM